MSKVSKIAVTRALRLSGQLHGNTKIFAYALASQVVGPLVPLPTHALGGESHYPCDVMLYGFSLLVLPLL